MSELMVKATTSRVRNERINVLFPAYNTIHGIKGYICITWRRLTKGVKE